MICPGTNVDCDNPGCRRGGCQGRMPALPLLRGLRLVETLAPLARRDDPRAAQTAEKEPIAA